MSNPIAVSFLDCWTRKDRSKIHVHLKFFQRNQVKKKKRWFKLVFLLFTKIQQNFCDGFRRLVWCGSDICERFLPDRLSAIFGNNYCHNNCPEFIPEQNLHINILEMPAIIVAVKTWGPLWKGKIDCQLCKCSLLSCFENRVYTRRFYSCSCLKEICSLHPFMNFK